MGPALESLLGQLPDEAKDLRLNLAAVLGEGTLAPTQRWGVAVACALASREPRLVAAVLADAAPHAGEGTLSDARAAAALMGMNNVFYRFKHQIGKSTYADKPAKLRMMRLGRPASTKVDLELYSLAASAIGGCEMCVQAHERTVIAGGMSEDQVHDAIRIASVVHGIAVALDGAPR